jgi:hypothetical protein
MNQNRTFTAFHDKQNFIVCLKELIFLYIKSLNSLCLKSTVMQETIKDLLLH